MHAPRQKRHHTRRRAAVAAAAATVSTTTTAAIAVAAVFTMPGTASSHGKRPLLARFWMSLGAICIAASRDATGLIVGVVERPALRQGQSCR